MRRCLQLAAHGLGSVAPNPMVGCVIVKNGKIIGEGFHREFGKSHAEVNAINSVSSPELLKGADLYVNLEPCSHQGKTPPCADLIASSGIARVFIAGTDPSEKVNGRGIQKLRDSGIEVVEGILSKEELELNTRFRTFHTSQRPYVILKWAQSLDGFMDKKREPGEGKQFPISNERARQVVHQWRAEEQAILVGAGTAETDDPQLNVRDVSGKNPLRILLDPSNRVNRSKRLFTDGLKTLVFGEGNGSASVEFIKADKENLLPQVLKELHRREILSVFVEGGKNTLEHLISASLWDEARIFVGNSHLSGGLRAPGIDGVTVSKSDIGDNKLIILRRRT